MNRNQKLNVRGQKNDVGAGLAPALLFWATARAAPTFCLLSSVFWYLSYARADWSMFRGNALRTGFSDGISCLNDPDSIKLKWEFNAPASITFSSPAIGNINSDSFLEVVIGCDDNRIYALRADSGKFLWSYPSNSYIQSSPLLIDLDGDDTLEIVFASFDSKVYAVDGYGNFLWSYPTGDWIFSSPVGGDIDLDDTIEIAIGSLDDWVYVLNGMNGSLKWKYKTGGDIYSSPALGDINQDDTLEIVVGSSDHKLYALHNGDTLWTYTAGDKIWSTPAIGDLDGDSALDIVFGCFDGCVYGLDGLTGDTLWTPYNVGGVIERESPGLADIDNDSLLEIVIGSFGAELLFCIEGESGVLKWAINPSSPQTWMIRTSPAIADIDGDGLLEIVLGTHDFYCTAIKSDGAIFWKYWVNGDPHSSPALADIEGDSCLEIVIATLSGDVLALDCHRRDDVGCRQSVEENQKPQTQNPKLEICPNPFIKKTVIRVRFPCPCEAANYEDAYLEIYDLTGRVVKSWDFGFRISDFHEVVWDGRDFKGRKVRSGIYFCKLKGANWTGVRKLICIR